MKTPLKLSSALLAAVLAALPSLHAAIGDIAVTNDAYSAVSVSTGSTLTVPDPAAGTIKGATGTTLTGAVLRITTNETTNRKIQVSQTGVPTGASITVELGSYSATEITEVNSGNPITITGTPADFITGIKNFASNVDNPGGIPLVYVLTLGENTPAGGVTVNVTYTILAE
jgi:hypothetical protein